MRVPRVISALFPYWCGGDSAQSRAFSNAVQRVDKFIERTGLQKILKYRALKVVENDVSGYAHITRTIYLNEEDAKHSDLTVKSKSYLYLHELGHFFLEEVLTKRSYKELKMFFGNFDKPYRRRPEANADIRDFVSYYAMVHPMDDFAETFAVCMYENLTKGRVVSGKSRNCKEKLAVMRRVIREYRD